MKSLTGMKIGLVFLMCLILSLSCSDKVTMRTHSEEFMFTINGVLVKDMNLSKDIAYFAILRDGNPFDSAVVKVGSDTLANLGNGNYYLEGFALFSHEATVIVSVSSAQDDFNVSEPLVIPGSFLIDELPSNDSVNVDGHPVPIQWSGSAQASGYFLSVVRPDGTTGFTQLDEHNNRTETIDREAFREGLEPIEGLYTVYVVAYSEGFPYYPGFPFELPSGLPTGNIEGANGTVGAGVIAPSVTIEVPPQR